MIFGSFSVKLIFKSLKRWVGSDKERPKGRVGSGSDNARASTLESLINRDKLIPVHNMEHPQKRNSQECNNCLFYKVFFFILIVKKSIIVLVLTFVFSKRKNL